VEEWIQLHYYYDIVKNYSKRKCFCLSFDYNQKHKKELEYAKKSCKNLGVNHKLLI
jgi:7-cyano-7-deazaguanine synthase in queuosine biosynthesis